MSSSCLFRSSAWVFGLYFSWTNTFCWALAPKSISKDPEQTEEVQATMAQGVKEKAAFLSGKLNFTQPQTQQRSDAEARKLIAAKRRSQSASPLEPIKPEEDLPTAKSAPVSPTNTVPPTPKPALGPNGIPLAPPLPPANFFSPPTTPAKGSEAKNWATVVVSDTSEQNSSHNVKQTLQEQQNAIPASTNVADQLKTRFSQQKPQNSSPKTATLTIRIQGLQKKDTLSLQITLSPNSFSDLTHLFKNSHLEGNLVIANNADLSEQEITLEKFETNLSRWGKDQTVLTWRCRNTAGTDFFKGTQA